VELQEYPLIMCCLKILPETFDIPDFFSIFSQVFQILPILDQCQVFKNIAE
jgi:hypothetical protein